QDVFDDHQVYATHIHIKPEDILTEGACAPHSQSPSRKDSQAVHTLGIQNILFRIAHREFKLNDTLHNFISRRFANTTLSFCTRIDTSYVAARGDKQSASAEICALLSNPGIVQGTVFPIGK